MREFYKKCAIISYITLAVNLILIYIHVYFFKPYMKILSLINLKSDISNGENMIVTIIPTLLLVIFFTYKTKKYNP